MKKEEIISLLNLEPHPLEGGYFRRTYESNLHLDCDYGKRLLMTSIYYLLTKESPVGFLNINTSDILHYHQLGAPIKYIIVSPDGVLAEKVLGPDIQDGQLLQMLVPGGWWKASRICDSKEDYALISEAVAPGFEYADNEIATEALVRQQFPAIEDALLPYIKRDGQH
jgi:hypothetical protein